MCNTEQATPARHRLPIYGESRWDRELRDLRDAPGFGTWMCDTYRDIRGFLDAAAGLRRETRFFLAVWAIDSQEDPAGLTMAECEELLAFDVERTSDSREWAQWEHLVAEWVDRFTMTSEVQRDTRHRCAVPLAAEHAPHRGGVYVIQQGDDGPLKIGVTTDVRKRMRSLQTGSPHPLRLVAIFDGNKLDEQKAHDRFAPHALSGEWFKPVPEILRFARECAAGSAPIYEPAQSRSR